MSNNLRWRSKLFSALGSGFLNDDTVEDGVHLRWISDQRLGLPVDDRNRVTGVFRVYHVADDFPSLHDTDLSSLMNNSSYTIYSTQNAGNESGLDTSYSKGTRFYKLTDLEINGLIDRFFTLSSWLNWDELTGNEKNLINYMREVLGGIQPELLNTNWLYELGEICAADVHVQLNDTANGTHAWVNGYDRHDNLIAQDWVGMSGGSPKKLARLIAPHIYYYKIENVGNINPVTENDVYWMFCEDYCKADVWDNNSIRRLFNIADGLYTPEFVETDLYAPFKEALDWGEAAIQLKSALVENEFVQAMVAQPDSYQMLKQKANLITGLPEDIQNYPEIELPVLSSLIQASIDPLMANILGFYYYGKLGEAPERDYKVEAYLPFFNEDNLLKLRDDIETIFIRHNLPSTTIELDLLTGLPTGFGNGNFTKSTALCGLVLLPEISTKPEPAIPSVPTIVIKTEDVPSQEDNGVMDIFVNARLQMGKAPFSTKPYVHPVAYQVERSLSGGEFINVVEQDNELDVLDGLGILPAIYLPKDIADQNFWELRDDFTLQITADDLAQYRIRGFDIFGRPSQPETSTAETISVPCYPPLRPTQLSVDIMSNNDDINLDLYFAVTDIIPPLRATQERVEITIYPLDTGATGPAELVTWSGNKLARTFNIEYLLNGAFLDLTSLSLGCTELSWAGDEIHWAATASGECDNGFPFDPLTLPLTEAATPVNAETETNYRLYRLQSKIGERSGLLPGNHRWCVRVRIAGRCDSGDLIHTGDVCVGGEHVVVPPPPSVLQPVLLPTQQLIPESTYADLAGDAFYYLDLQSFFPPGTQDEPLVNIYQVLLNRLSDPADIVDGDYFTDVGNDGLNGAERIQQIGRSNRQIFQRISELPVPLTPETRYFPVPVRGNLEEYFVLGVIGCDSEFVEKDWRHAAIVLFKTPQPVLTPKIFFDSAAYNISKSSVEVALNFRGEFATENVPFSPLPKVQIMRHDLSTGNKSFVGEAMGVAKPPEGDPGQEIYPYAFSFTDKRPRPHRRYRYEAILMQHTPKYNKYIKSKQTAHCELLVPYKGNVSPFIDSYGDLTQTGEGTIVSFTFNAGDFEMSLTRVLVSDNASKRYTGSIYRGELHGLPNSLLTINRSAGSYTLTYKDKNSDNCLYTLRLWQGQHRTWSQKVVKNV